MFLHTMIIFYQIRRRLHPEVLDDLLLVGYLIIIRLILIHLYSQVLAQIGYVTRLHLHPFAARSRARLGLQALEDRVSRLSILELEAGYINLTESSLAVRLLQVYQVGVSYADGIEQVDVISFIDVLRSKHSRLVCVVFAGELAVEALQGHRAGRKVIILGTDPIQVGLLSKQTTFQPHCSSSIEQKLSESLDQFRPVCYTLLQELNIQVRDGDELPQFESLGPFSHKPLMIPLILLPGLAMIPLIDQIQHNSHLLPDHFTHLVYELNSYLLDAAQSNMGKHLNAMHLQQPCPAIQHQAEPIERQKIIAFCKEFQYLQAATPQQSHQSAIPHQIRAYLHAQVRVLQEYMGFNMFQVEPRARRRLNTLLAQFTTLFFRKAEGFPLLTAPNHSLAHLSTKIWLKLAFEKMCLDEECILDYESHYNLILCTKIINTTCEFSITSVKHLEQYPQLPHHQRQY